MIFKTTLEEIAAVSEVHGINIERRSLIIKEMTDFLINTCTQDELIEASHRIAGLYEKACVYRFMHDVSSQPFDCNDVDVFAIATLQALKNHADHEAALEATWLIHEHRRISRNEDRYIRPPLYEHGIKVPLRSKIIDSQE